MEIIVGGTASLTRIFTEEEIVQFAEISGDKGRHHMEHDDKGRLMAHGLLTASISTQLGGEINYIARVMNYEFLRPVFAGDAITCEATITDVVEQEGFKKIAIKMVFTNQIGKEVIVGTTHGIIRD